MQTTPTPKAPAKGPFAKFKALMRGDKHVANAFPPEWQPPTAMVAPPEKTDKVD